jgi:DNA-binding FrmR family transcriptional regulator
MAGKKQITKKVVPEEEMCSSQDEQTVMECSDTSGESDQGENVETEQTEQKASTPKTRRTVVDKLDQIISMLENGSSVPSIIKQLHSIRKTLDGAQIKSTKKTRKPNSYNLFMSEEMEKLKDSTMPATEKFKHCINLWNEKKNITAVSTAIEVGCA